MVARTVVRTVAGTAALSNEGGGTVLLAAVQTTRVTALNA